MMVPSAMVKIRRLTKKTRYFTHGTAGFGSSSEKEHKMRILGIQLLILLCQSTLILCDSTTLVMNCTAQSNALENCGTDPCTWNISKKSFNILEYKCTDKDNKEVCSSLEECKLKNDHFTKFVKNMLSKIDCEHIQDNIECSSKLIKEKYDCNNQCLKGNYVCKFTISLAESVPVDGTFPVNGDFHCTVTNASEWSKISRIKGFDDTKEGFSDPIERNVNFKHATIGLGIVASILLIVNIVLVKFLPLQICRKLKKQTNQNRGNGADDSPDETIELKRKKNQGENAPNNEEEDNN